jgi:hypothetical protein
MAALRRIVDAAMTDKRGCQLSSCLHLEPHVSARPSAVDAVVKRRCLDRRPPEGYVIDEPRSVHLETYPFRDAVDPNGTATVPQHRPDIKVPLPLQPHRPATRVVTGIMAASPPTVEQSTRPDPQPPAQHVYHVPSIPHTPSSQPPAPQRSFRSLATHRQARGDATTPQKERKGQGDPAVSARPLSVVYIDLLPVQYVFAASTTSKLALSLSLSPLGVSLVSLRLAGWTWNWPGFGFASPRAKCTRSGLTALCLLTRLQGLEIFYVGRLAT